MATIAELKAEYADLQAQLAAVNTRILAILGRNNKRYQYSNQETTHQAETQSLTDLKEMKNYIIERMNIIENQLSPKFVQIKNC